MSWEYVRADKPRGHGWNTVRTGFLKAVAGRAIGVGFTYIHHQELWPACLLPVLVVSPHPLAHIWLVMPDFHYYYDWHRLDAL